MTSDKPEHTLRPMHLRFLWRVIGTDRVRGWTDAASNVQRSRVRAGRMRGPQGRTRGDARTLGGRER